MNRVYDLEQVDNLVIFFCPLDKTVGGVESSNDAKGNKARVVFIKFHYWNLSGYSDLSVGGRNCVKWI